MIISYSQFLFEGLSSAVPYTINTRYFNDSKIVEYDISFTVNNFLYLGFITETQISTNNPPTRDFGISFSANGSYFRKKSQINATLKDSLQVFATIQKFTLEVLDGSNIHSGDEIMYSGTISDKSQEKLYANMAQHLAKRYNGVVKAAFNGMYHIVIN